MLANEARAANSGWRRWYCHASNPLVFSAPSHRQSNDLFMSTRDDPRAPADEGHLESLMSAIKDGSQPALGELMDRLWPELVRYAARQLGDVEMARDIVQETFIQVWERRRAWTTRGSARAYLFRIARHLLIDEKRKQGVRRRWMERQERQDPPRPATPAEELDAKLMAESLEAAVAALPKRRREIFELVVLRGLSYAEVASVMGISVQTVANQLSRALRAVRRACGW